MEGVIVIQAKRRDGSRGWRNGRTVSALTGAASDGQVGRAMLGANAEPCSRPPSLNHWGSRGHCNGKEPDILVGRAKVGKPYRRVAQTCAQAPRERTPTLIRARPASPDAARQSASARERLAHLGDRLGVVLLAE